jgi:hypothetical protein
LTGFSTPSPTFISTSCEAPSTWPQLGLSFGTDLEGSNPTQQLTLVGIFGGVVPGNAPDLSGYVGIFQNDGHT